MWITKEVPHNRPSDYQNAVPFNGVILWEPEEAKAACGLVGTFEGPRHIYIDLTIQSRGSPERRALDRFLVELRDRTLALVPALDSEEHDPGFFSIEVTGDGVRSDPRARPSGAGTPEPAPRRPPSVGPRPRPPRPPGPRRRSPPHRSQRIEAQVTALKEADGIRLRAKPLEDADNAELRVVLSDGSDETCDSPAPDQYLEIGKGAELGGQPVNGYVKDQQGARRAVLLGSVASDGRETGHLDSVPTCWQRRHQGGVSTGGASPRRSIGHGERKLAGPHQGSAGLCGQCVRCLGHACAEGRWNGSPSPGFPVGISLLTS